MPEISLNQYITMDELRLFLIDRVPLDNFLLDDIEFCDDQVLMAMDMVIDRYNSQTPIGIDWQTVRAFPWRHEMMLGTAAFLLRMRAINMIRNTLSWNNGGGVAVDERSNAKDYLATAGIMMKEFDDRIAKIKQSINISAGFGALSSQYMGIR